MSGKSLSVNHIFTIDPEPNDSFAPLFCCLLRNILEILGFFWLSARQAAPSPHGNFIAQQINLFAALHPPWCHQHRRHEKSKEMAKKAQFVLASETKMAQKAQRKETRNVMGVELYDINQL